MDTLCTVIQVYNATNTNASCYASGRRGPTRNRLHRTTANGRDWQGRRPRLRLGDTSAAGPVPARIETAGLTLQKRSR
ncbi:unnamed protein product [Lasius platythorax]|uniref:Uncharacterized protein n=1 Tax=Lasius platythorax TaxID=488582 RepID=A0AAV2N2G0_9HYME